VSFAESLIAVGLALFVLFALYILLMTVLDDGLDALVGTIVLVVLGLAAASLLTWITGGW